MLGRDERHGMRMFGEHVYRPFAAASHVRFGLDWLQCIRQSDEGRMT